MLSKKLLLQTKLSKLHSRLRELPKASLHCNYSGKYPKWYYLENGKYVYIPRKNRKFAEQLAESKYLSLLSKELEQELAAVNLYLHHASSSVPRSELLLQRPEYRDLLSSLFITSDQEILNWLNASFPSNPYNSEALIHKCPSGHLVRSKSETIIDTCLFLHKIPFRYECLLQLGQSTFYPDFTIMHPQTKAIFYWEHMGMVDEPGYFQKNQAKLQQYVAHGIIPSVSLILTYETKDHPLDADYVEKLIEYYFL